MIESYVEGGHWSPDSTSDYWDRNGAFRRGEPALSDGSATYTWAEGVRASDAIASGLVDAGVPRDGVLLVQVPNSALSVLSNHSLKSA